MAFFPEVKRKLRQIFNLTSFRPHQLEVISTTLSGEDAVVLMPTGGGKSLCYQLPAICDSGKTRGVTVVICPLLALMINQVEALKEKGVDVAFYNSEQDAKESDQVTRRLRSKGNRPRIFYITPEKLKHSSLVGRLLNEIRDDRELARFVIDEGHLVIKWGRDFREAYKYLECLRTDFPGIPIMALTATATQQVKEDLIRILKIRGCKVYWQSMNRPNLNYEVRPKKGVDREIVQFIRAHHAEETGIIYARSRQTCENVAKKLRESYGLKARHFHAKMQNVDKKDALAKWQSGQCKIIVATIAFGMGIDKPDVRYVIHHDLPNDLDGYYQETGRAGRDGKPADCILYYSWGDVNTRRRMIRDNTECDSREKEHQEQEILRVAQFCQNNVDCRRTQVLAYYNETFDPDLCENGCDNCRNPSGIEEEDVTDMAVKIIQLAEVLVDGGKFTITRNQLLEFLWGKSGASTRAIQMQSHELFGSGKNMPRDRTERIADRLESMGIFRIFSKQNGEWSAAYLEVRYLCDLFTLS
ncbi:P-loop containing nucleoside triphosphate hydrolase protein [Fomitopsis serialis]|uniref:P-loop containing nucleoside triphosphate hydrolase protein n=1 Tax=Fomitopsis serialis TaxID=139415 RepID=UPI002008E889|nr:P-loop containing nucleoside triphosphate hydrolase protein [Neoantrodia serialis]KAH9925306.1 P-loop containing nucleoside triphosphate hydrolase protein [Neoantrodia serialis]